MKDLRYLVIICLLLFLNLLAYANFFTLDKNLTFDFYNFFISVSSVFYIYISSSDKLSIKRSILLVFLVGVIYYLQFDHFQFTVIISILILFINSQKQIFLLTLIKLFVAIILQLILSFIYFNFINDSQLLFTFIYLPFSVILFLIWKEVVKYEKTREKRMELS